VTGRHRRDSETDVMPACCCQHDGNGGGRHGWDPWCAMHGIEARIAAGVWAPGMRDLWNQARCEGAR